MLAIYPACFYEEETGGYSVIFPDLNHLATCGETFADAMQMAVDCLAGYLYDLKQMGEKAPQPSAIDAIRPDDEYDEYKRAFVSAVSVDVEEYAKAHFEKSVKKTLTIPKWLNDMAVSENINFSQLLQAALKEKLHVS